MIISLFGYKEVGKSQVATILETQGFVRVGFIDAAREMLAVLGVPQEHITGSAKNVPMPMFGGKSGRFALKTLTTEWARELFGEDFWINIAAARLQALEASFGSEEPKIVIEDMRLEAEAIFSRQVGAHLLRVDRPGKGPEMGADGHRTENEITLIMADGVIYNDGSLDDLELQVARNLDRFRQKRRQPVNPVKPAA